MYKAIKDNKIIATNETDNFPCMEIGTNIDEVVEDTDHNVDDFIHVDGEFVLKTDDKAIAYMKSNVRAVRNSYLEEYIDKVVSNTLRWNDLSSEEQEKYKAYRRYLLDYSTEDNWWQKNPLNWSEWNDNLV